MARIAASLTVLRDQVDTGYPNRRKRNDGWIGDDAHKTRDSDHNPNRHGVVTALDLTHDPANGFDSYAFADTLKATRDPRIKYLISNRRISNPSKQNGAWRDYDVMIHTLGISTFQCLPIQHFMTIHLLGIYQRVIPFLAGDNYKVKGLARAVGTRSIAEPTTGLIRVMNPAAARSVCLTRHRAAPSTINQH